MLNLHSNFLISVFTRTLFTIGLLLLGASEAYGLTYTAEINLGKPILGNIQISPQKPDIDILTIAIDGKPYLSQKQNDGKFTAKIPANAASASTIKIYFDSPNNLNGNRIPFNIENGNQNESYEPPVILLDGLLLNVTDSLTIGKAGAQDTHKVGFLLTTSPIQPKGEIWINFSTGFDVGGITFATYSDNYPGNDTLPASIDTINVLAQTVKITMDSGVPADTGRINLSFGLIHNDTIASDYHVTVITLDSLGNVINGPVSSWPFRVAPTVLEKIVISPDTALLLPSDTIVMFGVAALDSFDNHISGLSYTWGITVDSCGAISNGIFRALKTGVCKITVSSGGLSDTSGQITVTPGAFGRFGFSGYPASRTAGASFPGSDTVTVYDINNNIKTDYLDSLYFTSTDTHASLPYTFASKYHFQIADSGRHIFAGLGFKLRSSGSQTISVTDGAHTTTSSSIVVSQAGISTFSISANANQTAGVAFALSVSNALDSLGNPASGTVIVSADTGGGVSPGGVPPAFNNIDVMDGNGLASQTLTNAIRTVLKGVAGNSAYAVVRVLPGVLGNLRLVGAPDSITAGNAFPSPQNNIVVTLYDLYGNRRYNSSEIITFTSTDASAVLPGAYTYTVPDSGIHTFAGSAFTLRTVGLRKIIVNRGALTDSSSNIQVNPAPINSYTLWAPVNTMAGTAVICSVTTARDAFNNIASGMVTISDSIGAGNSPDSTPPIFNYIIVNNGSGAAAQILTKTGSARLKGISNSGIIRGTDIIAVAPGVLGELDMVVASPQISGVRIAPVSTITAKDNYGNLKSNFNAAADSVVIASTPSGPIANNILKQPADFNSGIADLWASNVIYRGHGGQITFSAVSQSGISGHSNVVDIASLRADSVTLNTRQVARGDTVAGSARFTTLGGVPVTITSLSIFDDSSRQYSLLAPVLPDSVSGGIDTAYTFRFVVPGDIGQGRHRLAMKITGSYSGFLISDSLASYTDSLTVLTASHLVYVSASSTPDTVSTGESYPFAINLRNTGDARISLSDTSNIAFSDGSHLFRANLSQSGFIDPGVQIQLQFLTQTVNNAFISGNYPLKFHYYGNELNGGVIDSLIAFDSVLVQSTVNITYNATTMAPDTILTGAPIRFHARVHNSGLAVLQLDQSLSKVSFSDGTHQYLAQLDTTAGLRINRIIVGDTTLTFATVSVPSQFAPGRYRPVIHVEGTQNQRAYQTSLSAESLSVLSPGILRLDSLYVVSPNSPNVNISQVFHVRGRVSNLGIEPADSIRLRLVGDGQSAFDSSFAISSISGLASAPFSYQVTAAGIANPLEIFHCYITRAINRISGQNSTIAPSLDYTAAVVIQDSAIFHLAPIIANDSALSTGQLFTVSATATHIGSNSYTGSNQLVIDFSGDGGFVVTDSLRRDFVSGQSVSWNVRAPSTAISSRNINIRFSGHWIDLNDSTTALAGDSIRTLAVAVSNRASVSHHAVITSPIGATDGTLSTFQFFTFVDSVSPSGNHGSSFAMLTLPSGFSCADPLIQSTAGNHITWEVAVPENATIDSLRTDCWAFDTNTGDSTGTAPNWQTLHIIPRSVLTIGADIIEPPSATDRIIEPGGYFVVRALVSNLGQAPTNSGKLRIAFENNQFTVTDSLVRDFIPGAPVEWTVNAPDTQILSGTAVAVLISSMPIDSNSNTPAFVANDSTGFTVILKNELPHLVLQNAVSPGGAAVKGQPVEIYRFTLKNSIEIANNQIALLSFTYRIYSGNTQINPAQVISASTVNINGLSHTGVLTDSTISFVFSPDIVIEPESLANISLSVTIAENPAFSLFRIGFISNDIQAKVVIGGLREQSIQVVLPDGDNFAVGSTSMAVLESAFTGSVSLSQNPFLPADGALRIGYNLATDANVSFILYSADGFKIWERDIAGTEGEHYADDPLLWDGKNSSGDKVLSGFYYLFVTNNATGEKAKIKIAVVW